MTRTLTEPRSPSQSGGTCGLASRSRFRFRQEFPGSRRRMANELCQDYGGIQVAAEEEEEPGGYPRPPTATRPSTGC